MPYQKYLCASHPHPPPPHVQLNYLDIDVFFYGRMKSLNMAIQIETIEQHFDWRLLVRYFK